MKSTEPVLLAKCNHIFAWPFEYQWPKDDVENYAEPFKKKGWIEKDMDIQGMRKNGKIQKDIFMLNQYLSSSAKDIFMQTGENICTILEYPFDEKDEWKYQIKVGNQYYLLPIQSVELHVYRHGVGILFIQMSNNDYPSLQDIKKINDYGRRISMPLIPDTLEKDMLCADEIGIVGPKEKYLTNFKK